MAAQSLAWVCGRQLVGITGSNPARGWMSAYSECCRLSGRGLYVELITRLEESDRLWCVFECHREASITRRPWPTGVLLCYWAGGGGLRL